MKDEKALSTVCAACLLANVVILRLFSAEPNFFTGYSLSAAAIFFVLSFAVFLIWWVITLRLVPYEDRDILSLLEDRYGKTAKTVFALAFSLYFSAAVVASARNLSAIPSQGSYLPALISAVFVLLAAVAAFFAFARSGRLHFVGTILCVLIIVLAFAFSTRLININNLFPLFGNGYKSMLFGFPRAASIFSGFIVILLIIPLLGARKALICSFWGSVITIFAVSAVFLYLITLALPRAVLLASASPLHELIRTLPPTLSSAISWAQVILSFIYISAMLYLASLTLAKALNLPAKYITFPLAILLWLCSMLKIDSAVMAWIFAIFWDFSWIFGLLLPMIAAIMLKLKGGKSDACL